ncbi:MAG: hypothetical protein R2712_03220 [Vicinamibacterales bacterium]
MDVLTGLATQRRLEAVTADRLRAGDPCALLLLDWTASRWSTIRSGARPAMQLLRRVAQRLLPRRGRTTSWHASEEDAFAVVVARPGAPDALAEVARRILDVVQRPC